MSWSSKCLPLVVAALLASLAPAFAHTADISTAKITPEKDRSYQIDVGFLATDLERIFSQTMAERVGVELSQPGVLETQIGKLVQRRVSMHDAEGHACAGRVDYAGEDPANADSALVKLKFDCSGVAGQIFYDAKELLAVAGSKAKHLVTLTGENAGETMLYPADPPLDLSKPLETVWQLMWKFVQAGVEHILTGYDHVCFLIAILLWATRVWPVVKIVTAFTVSHSITLSLAALDIVTLPSQWVEAAIAASIIYVAVENFFSRRVDGRWRDTFLFGFIHGFGFASSLKELGVPANAVLPALASFNIGVELGQVAIVLVFVPALLFIDKQTGGKRSPRLVYALSAAIALLGAYWLLERVGALDLVLVHLGHSA
ncbi:HupE/UreJ family protein [Methylosinus sp. KRF6]|uniref:HupE/UreJ family protein n=1 Tax=Methylosinus sp. KRF6 TaxID=2846853 RepID=UPI001C0C9B4E|nr:HupE/UreJ family protein [Methylosinus sp. KRF6]MBU3888954.1 HupE/UreJ family protein [Methylosinus sp. KRF6]